MKSQRTFIYVLCDKLVSWPADPNFRFGSVQALQKSSISTAAIERKAEDRERLFKNQNLNVCYFRKRSFKSWDIEQIEGQKTARSGLKVGGYPVDLLWFERSVVKSNDVPTMGRNWTAVFLERPTGNGALTIRPPSDCIRNTLALRIQHWPFSNQEFERA